MTSASITAQTYNARTHTRHIRIHFYRFSIKVKELDQFYVPQISTYKCSPKIERALKWFSEYIKVKSITKRCWFARKYAWIVKFGSRVAFIRVRWFPIRHSKMTQINLTAIDALVSTLCTDMRLISAVYFILTDCLYRMMNSGRCITQTRSWEQIQNKRHWQRQYFFSFCICYVFEVIIPIALALD